MAEDRSPVSRLVGALISPAVDAVDPDAVIERVDIDHLVARIDIDALAQRIDIDALLARVDLNALLAELDLNALLAGVDIDALAARLDLDVLVARVDLNAALAEVDLDALVARLDLNAALARVDIDAVAARLDIEALVRRIDIDDVVKRIDVADVVHRIDVADVVRRIDVDDVVKRIDVADVVHRIDVDDVVRRIDISALVDRIDIDGLVSRIDLDKQLESVDIHALVERAEIDKIVAEATTGVASRTLDLARRQVVGIDLLIERGADRLMRRPVQAVTKLDGKADVAGRHGGPLARSLAFMADAGVVAALFGAGAGLVGWLAGIFGISSSLGGKGGPVWFVLYLGWWFLYLWGAVAIAGRTPGKWLVGLRVTAIDAAPLSSWRAAVRALAFPFSAVLAIGFLIGLLRRDRRCLHDLVAGSAVLTDWGQRQARLPSALDQWIAQRHPATPAPNRPD